VPYFDGGDMGPQEAMPGGRVALGDLLRAYTLEAARALGMESLIGSIEVGKRADLVLLERNLFSIAPQTIYGTPVRLTLLDGRVVYAGERAE
jgi:predicted amidohydrolase YtcJ